MEDRQQLFADRLETFAPVPWEQIPDFGLYMDQVVTFIEKQCRTLFVDGERVFTPAMVNNYVKFGLVGRPNGKKYGREQLAQLLMICVLKQAASADGLKALLKPADGQTLKEHYELFCQTETETFATLGNVLPLPSPMICAMRGAAYQFLCNALLVKPPQPAPEPRHAPKPETASAKSVEALQSARAEEGKSIPPEPAK